MTQYVNKSALVAEIERLIEIANNNYAKFLGNRSAWAQQRCVCEKLLSFLDTLEVKKFQEKNLYVVTRCEEHSDYVEKVFFSKKKAEEYCKQFEGNEDAYGRDITEIKVDCPPFEMKEVDLEKEIELVKGDYEQVDVAWNNDFDFIARHFFELGFKAQSKDMIEALRTEYEKGRADVIADTISWLENCWPKYCSNQTIIEGYKEAIKD